MSTAIPSMIQVGRRVSSALHALEEHEVIRVAPSGEAVVVATAEGELEARRALSCLVMPEPGDVVLVASIPSGALVLAVVARPGGGPLVLASERDVALRSGGALSMDAARVAVRAERLEVIGRVGRAALDEAELVATKLRTVATHARVVLDKVEALLGDVSMRARSSYREVDGADVTRAGDVDTRARGTHCVSARHATVIADQLVRLDGEQIHMG